MSEHIRWDALAKGWAVYQTGEFARYVATFETLLAAERYVIDGTRGNEVAPS